MATRFGGPGIAAERILGLLRSDDFREIGSHWGAHDLLRGLENTISAIALLFPDAEKNADDESPIRNWLWECEKELEHAVDFLEDLATTRANYKMRPKQVCGFFPNHQLSQLNIMRQKMKNIIRELDRSTIFGGVGHGLEERSDKKKIQFPNDGVEEVESFVVQGGVTNSWDQVVKVEITNILLDMKFERNVMVLPLIILGEETTMFTWDVFYDGRVGKHFHRRIWLRVSNDDVSIEILREIVTHAAGPDERNLQTSNEDELINLLSASLSGVRYLVVFCNPFSGDLPENLLFLIDLLLGIGDKGSKIVVTSSNQELPISITGSTIQPYRVGCPSEDELWSLFEKVAFGQHPKDSSEQYSFRIQVGKSIVRTNRLPLVTAAMGSMLYFETSGSDWMGWKPFHGSPLTFRWPSDNYYQDSYFEDHMLSLERCYDHLPLPLKHCFAYCSLFPIDYEIDVQTMIKLWMAQGFIIDQSGRSLEDVGYDYFLNLLRRFFFQEPKIDVRRRVIKCKMHPLMHHLATLLARKQCYLFSPDAIHKYDNRSSHVSFGFDLFAAEVAKDFSWIYTRSFLLQSQLWEKYSGRHANYDAIISRCGLLRALDLGAIGIRIVPSSIGELKFLKYLDLSENGEITRLPNSITNLLKLQTLKLSSCFKLRELPRDIENLVNLRHLGIDGCYNLTSLPRGFGQLTNLQTLSQIVLSKDSSKHDAELKAVNGLVNLREEFQIKNLRHEKDVTVYVNVVPCGVRSLSLEWDSHAPKSNDKETPTDQREDLFTNLEELTVNGFNGVTLFSPGISSRLVKLTLRRCANCQYLPSLDQLLHLKVLQLDEMIKLEYISNKDSSSASTTFFPCLQELWLTELPQLQGWWKNGVNDLTASYPCLSKLVIEDCPNLASMPLFPTLEEGLVLDTTRWKPFQLTMEHKTTAAYDEASSSTSPPPSAPLSKLKNLCIVGIKDCKVEEIKWETLKSLRFLRFDCLPQLTTLPEGLQRVTSLQELHVWRCGIEEIPHWISKLVLLKKLGIRVCSNLKSLPKEIRSLCSLQTLEIEDCNTLLKRCEKEIGADWKRIASIPYKRLGPISGR